MSSDMAFEEPVGEGFLKFHLWSQYVGKIERCWAQGIEQWYWTGISASRQKELGQH